MIDLRTLSAQDVYTHIEELSSVLVDCVEGGASVSFMAGISDKQANDFFGNVAASIQRGERMLLAAFLEGTLAGTVQIVTSMPENQPHRAEIAKLLVTRPARGRGLGTALMRYAEELSRLAGKTLLVLDTATGSDAERLYERLGWTRAGAIPNYSMLPNGQFCGTTIFWKQISA
ncbi:MAG TPA: GNAT family N-acetyltransferase [Bryobacteraceae bacterium]|nr:GNAT family N-acetyltransferase [Bryobacteraceae bacterium]